MDPGSHPLDRLAAMRTRFGADAGAERLALLEELASAPLRTNPRRLACHELLLFVAGHPDDRRVRVAALAGLERVLGEVEAQCARPPGAAWWAKTGVAGSTVSASFSLELVRGLVERYPELVTLDSVGADEATVREVLALVVPPSEQEVLVNNDVTLDRAWELWGAAASGRLAHLVGLVAGAGLPGRVADRLYSDLQVYVDVLLRPPAPSRSRPLTLTRRLFTHRTPLLRSADPAVIVRQPLPPSRPLTAAEQEVVLETARFQLLGLYRETDPVTFAGPEGVALYDLGRGVDVATFTMRPGRRRPVDAYIGFLAFKNQIPLAYGGAWMLGANARIGINVFPTFRGGESAFLFAQLLRLYHQAFGPDRFTVEPFQIGRDNPDGIRSGAFWFYHRLGFRPAQPFLRELADEEHRRNRAAPGRRSTPAVLRRLAGAEMEWTVPGAEGPPRYDALGVSSAVSAAVAGRFGGDHAAAQRWAEGEVAAWLGVDPAGWPDPEREAFAGLALVLALVPGRRSWTRGERAALATAVRAKAADEPDHIRRVRAHPRLLEGLAEMVGPEG